MPRLIKTPGNKEFQEDMTAGFCIRVSIVHDDITP